MTKGEKIKLLKFRASVAKWSCIISAILIGIINSPNVLQMNYVLWPVFFISIFYSLYDYHLWLNTDAYKEDKEDGNTEDFTESNQKEHNTDNEEEHPD